MCDDKYFIMIFFLIESVFSYNIFDKMMYIEMSGLPELVENNWC